jgi:copper oxidase (laccase) domain-containing protein
MSKAFGSHPENILAVIGPSICMDCYEIGDDVADEFIRAFSSEEQSTILVKNQRNRYQLNLWEANRRILLAAGLKDENIHLSGVCTSCNCEILFSHRRSRGKRGSLAAFLAIKE